MPRSIPTLVKPKLLAWARKSAGLTLEAAAAKTKLNREVMEAWENGDGAPSLSQLRKLGEVYKRPIAIFFLPEPPLTFDAQREFRRLAGILPGKESPELRLALRNAVFRREAALELHRLTGDPLPHIDVQLHPGMDPEEVGKMIRQLLGISWDQQISWSSAHEAINAWRTAIERLGVLVFQASGVTLEEIRGTCIPDQPLPVVVLNSKDAPHGRIFTLVHEFVHILLHNGGHQTSRMVGARSPEEQPLEVAANAIAAATLLPADDFPKVAALYRGAASGEDNSLRLLAQRVKVSPEVILRRLVTLHQASAAVYRTKRDAWGKTTWYVKASTGGAIPMQVKTLASAGRGYTRLVLNAYDQRLISTSAASDYLGVKPRHFNNIRRELTAKPALTEP
jgi:Zn-dependent peptidase ImmA (M78 family)/transcriptional regulator with XRE-family HTH domain